MSAPISPSASPAAGSETQFSSSLTWRILEHWHLLSLDAPTVAVTWCCVFSRAAGKSLTWQNGLALGIATWLLYVADRLLDGLTVTGRQTLQQRHHFHARHRKIFLSAAIPAAVLLVWLGTTHLDPAQLLNDLRLGAAAGAYLLCVHLPKRFTAPGMDAFLPKELAVALIFAAACVLPAWTQVAAQHAWLMLMGMLFAMLCWLNCIAIETWEATPAAQQHSITRRIGMHFGESCIGLCLCACGVALAAALVGKTGFACLALCVAGSAWLLRLLHHARNRMHPLHLRAAADAVLLTPLAAFCARAK